jgi:putative tricarboxylic transport membrane protein
MTLLQTLKRAAIATTIASAIFGTVAMSADKVVDSIHFLIPGGAGGG